MSRCSETYEYVSVSFSPAPIIMGDCNEVEMGIGV